MIARRYCHYAADAIVSILYCARALPRCHAPLPLPALPILRFSPFDIFISVFAWYASPIFAISLLRRFRYYGHFSSSELHIFNILLAFHCQILRFSLFCRPLLPARHACCRRWCLTRRCRDTPAIFALAIDVIADAGYYCRWYDAIATYWSIFSFSLSLMLITPGEFFDTGCHAFFIFTGRCRFRQAIAAAAYMLMKRCWRQRWRLASWRAAAAYAIWSASAG